MEHDAERQFISFRLAGLLFGVDVLLVREINRRPALTQVDPSPDFVRGLMNLRGQIVTVVDLGVRLGLGPCEVSNKARCVVLKTRAELRDMEDGTAGRTQSTTTDIVGLLVDEIGDLVVVPSSAIVPPPPNVSGIEGRLLCGVVRLENDLLAVLDLAAVLAATV